MIIIVRALVGGFMPVNFGLRLPLCVFVGLGFENLFIQASEYGFSAGTKEKK